MQPTPSPIHHRWALLAAALLSLLAGLPPYVLPVPAGRSFPLPLDSALTAMSLGGCYLAGAVALFAAWRERSWGAAVVIGPGVFAGTTLTVAVTLLHFGDLRLAGGPPVAAAAAAWLAAAVLAPAGWLFLVFANDLGWTADPARRRPLPRPLLTLVALQSLLLLAAGAGLFVAPEAMPWPWRLGSPADRLAGAQLVAFGLTGLAVLVERDEGRTRAAFAGCLGLGLLEAAALAVQHSRLRLSWAVIAYGIFLAGLVAAGLLGLRRGMRDARPRAAPLVR